MRVLVVEDDGDLSRQLVTALTDAGYAADAAFDGEEGAYLGETEPYDAIILDLGLPKIDGLSVLERWRRTDIKTPVLILTARDRWSEKVAGINAGADDYVAKPFQMEEVIARIRALLRRSAGVAKPELECGLSAGYADVARDFQWHGRQADRPRVQAAFLPDASPVPGRLTVRTRRPSLPAGFRPRFQYDRSVHRTATA